MSIANLSLKELKDFEADIPLLARFPSRALADTYDSFLDILYDDIDEIIRDIEANREFYCEDGEDKLTVFIAINLRRLGYDAEHGVKHGGNTDLLVKRKAFTWIAEAKIHSSYDYLYEGFLQLDTSFILSVGL
jgi:hypothetical protein